MYSLLENPKRSFLQVVFLQAIIAGAIFQVNAKIRCFTCVNAKSNEECNQYGVIKVCGDNEQSCQNELRLNTPDGFGYLISKRCKQPLACRNMQNQNKRPAWFPTQCNPLFKKNSVCQCCCKEDLCNQKDLPCGDILRCPQRGDMENGFVTCTNYNFEGSKCEYKCKNGFQLEGQRSIECVNKGGIDLVWTDKEPVCLTATCIGVLQAPVYGTMSCTDNVNVGSVCSFACSIGYELNGPKEIECQSDGRWAAQAPKCKRLQCNKPQNAPDNGGVVCSSDKFYQSVCQFTCNNGYRMQGSSASTCQLSRQWSSKAPTCERIVCNDLSRVFPNGQRSCTDEYFVGSICTYSCNRGYFRDDSAFITCLGDAKWSSKEPECKRILCSPMPVVPTNGEYVCTDNNAYASVCEFFCDDGYSMRGPSTTTCQDSFKWSDDSPDCVKIECDRSHEFIRNGEVACTSGKDYASNCKFTCNEGFFRVGPEILTCQANSKWTDIAPVCEAHTCKPDLRAPRNGRIDCTDGINSFSLCRYTCGDGSRLWESEGEMKAACLKNQTTGNFQWNNTKTPCCARRCPPYTKLDLFVVLDSSSSVGQENWNKTLHFVVGVIDDFDISPDDLLVGLIRYNTEVDVDSEIQIGQFVTKEDTTAAILNMPYNGQGTNTGNALKYVVDGMMASPGNRREVEDMVLLITDGRSRDDVKQPSATLRGTGADVIALGISNRKGQLGVTKEDLLDITADPEKTIVSTDGFAGITPNLVQVFIKKICLKPCERQMQYYY